MLVGSAHYLGCKIFYPHANILAKHQQGTHKGMPLQQQECRVGSAHHMGFRIFYQHLKYFIYAPAGHPRGDAPTDGDYAGKIRKRRLGSSPKLADLRR
jgi:hypothetical protein